MRNEIVEGILKTKQNMNILVVKRFEFLIKYEVIK